MTTRLRALDSLSIGPRRLVEKVSLRSRSLAEIMAPSRKGSKSNRSENANDGTIASPASRNAAPNGGVTREELDTVVAELHQQIAIQNNEMLKKLTALLAAQNKPTTQRVNTNGEENSYSSTSDQQRNKDVEAHHTEANAGLGGNLANDNNLNAHRPDR